MGAEDLGEFHQAATESEMNPPRVKLFICSDMTKLFYSHDDSITRYVVELTDHGYRCRLNEVPCFKRRTHELMAKVYGVDLNELACHTFTRFA
jgi:hypothetical protein